MPRLAPPLSLCLSMPRCPRQLSEMPSRCRGVRGLPGVSGRCPPAPQDCPPHRESEDANPRRGAPASGRGSPRRCAREHDVQVPEPVGCTSPTCSTAHSRPRLRGHMRPIASEAMAGKRQRMLAEQTELLGKQMATRVRQAQPASNPLLTRTLVTHRARRSATLAVRSAQARPKPGRM